MLQANYNRSNPPLFKIRKPLVAKSTDPARLPISRAANLRITPLSSSRTTSRNRVNWWRREGQIHGQVRVDGLSVTVQHLITSVKRSRLNSGYELTNPLSETTRPTPFVRDRLCSLPTTRSSKANVTPPLFPVPRRVHRVVAA